MQTQCSSDQKIQEKNKELSSLPGPKGLDLWRWGVRVPRRPLETYQELHQVFGDLAYCGWNNRETIFVFHPDGIRHILRDNHQNYVKGRDYEHMQPLLGQGLLLSEGDLWRRQRQIMAKEFHHARVESYKPVISSQATKLVTAWKNGGSIDVAPWFMETTFEIACRIFFGTQFEGHSETVRHALEAETLRTSNRIRRIFNLPRRFPILENIRGERAINILKMIVNEVVQKSDRSSNNVLSRLLSYKDAEGNGLPLQLIQDEVMTLMLAGHETTSNVLSWTMLLLAQNKEWQDMAREDRSEKVLHNCILESMRLFPPAPMVSRTLKENDTLLGYPIPAGANVLVLQWVTHRDPLYWDNPEIFNPERFEKPLKHQYSFFPFAYGPRSCIGEEMAMVETTIILRQILDHFRIDTEPGFIVQPVHNVTLRPKNGVKLRLHSLHH